MKSWQTRVLIFVTIACQALSAVWGGQPVYYAHCHEHEAGDDHCDHGCDPASCLAVLDHEHDHDEHLAEPGDRHHCHCHHFHFRGDANRFERRRLGEVVRRQGSPPATVPGPPQNELFGWSPPVAACPHPTAAAPPPQRLLAIHAVRLLV